jgi:hypothetical protein
MAYVSPAQGIISGIDSLAGAVERRNDRVENTRRYEQEHAFRQEQADTSNAFRQEQAGLRQENWRADFKQRAENYGRQSDQWQQAFDMEKDEKARAAGQEFITRGGPLALSIAKHNPHMAMQTWNMFAPEDQQITALEWEDEGLNYEGAMKPESLGRSLVGTFANGEQFRYHEDDVDATVEHYYPKKPVAPHNVPSGAVALDATGKLLYDNRKGGAARTKINLGEASGSTIYKNMVKGLEGAVGRGGEPGTPSAPPPNFGDDEGGKMLSILDSAVSMGAPMLANAGINIFNAELIDEYPDVNLMGVYAGALKKTYDSFDAERIRTMFKETETAILASPEAMSGAPRGKGQAAFVSNMAATEVAKKIANVMNKNGRAAFEGQPLDLGLDPSEAEKKKTADEEAKAAVPVVIDGELDIEGTSKKVAAAAAAKEVERKEKAAKEKAAKESRVKNIADLDALFKKDPARALATAKAALHAAGLPSETLSAIESWLTTKIYRGTNYSSDSALPGFMAGTAGRGGSVVPGAPPEDYGSPSKSDEDKFRTRAELMRSIEMLNIPNITPASID